MDLRGAVAIVTGAGRGIGAATVRALSDRGAHVIAVGLDEAELDAVADRTGALPITADVRDLSHADRIVATALDRHGRLDVVVANAGIGHAGAFVDMTPERIDDLIAVNVRAPMLLARAALPSMLAQGRGAVVLVSSVVGAVPVPRESVYSATKAAIDAFAEPLREELRGSGVTVTTIVPAVVDTDFFRDRGEPYLRRFPRPLPPERIASAVVVRAIERGDARVLVPSWIAIPIRLRGIAPRLYRALARRFS